MKILDFYWSSKCWEKDDLIFYNIMIVQKIMEKV